MESPNRPYGRAQVRGGVCAAGYQPGTIERGLLEQFAGGDMAYQDEIP